MNEGPIVVVHPPDHRGMREVWIRGQLADKVWSASELRTLLDHSRLAHVELEDRDVVEWRGAGPRSWPDKTANRYATGTLLALGLIGSMVLLISVGQVDALRSPYFANRITGFLLVAGGAVQAMAAITAVDFAGKRRLQYSGALTLAGVLIALFSNGLFLALWATEMEYRTPLLPAFTTLLIWALWATWLLIKERAWQGVSHPRGIAVGFMVTTALTAANLAKSSWYEPSIAPIQVVSTAKFGKAEIKGNFVHVPVTFTVKNFGKVPVYIPVSIFWVAGRRIEPTQEDRKEETWEAELEEGKDFDLYAKPPQKSTILSTGELVGAGSAVNPNDQFELHKLITLPKSSTFTTLNTGVEVHAFRKDFATLPSALKRELSWKAKCERPPCEKYVTYFGPIESSNNMINVTRLPRYLHAWWIMHPHANDSWIAADVRRYHSTRVTPDWEHDKTHVIERVRAGSDLVLFRSLVADATKDTSQ
ncbi:hypothetical protein ACFV0B_24155 [Streptomyces xanthophaeus]|uniref:hypothetical protein n=1 Tax=Streptomyces xanthophaeus TaxID=67385 RepID=UPI00369DB815